MNTLKALFLSISKEAQEDLGLLVYNYFKDNPNPADEDFHKFIESKGINVHVAEAEAYKLATLFVQFMEGGKSKKENIDATDVDPKQLDMGIKVEHEHIENDYVATKIALDHLAEFPTYYDALDDMENRLKNK